MKKIKDAVAITGTYMKDGEEKKRYMNIGVLLERDDGSTCLKLEAVPTNFDGWINFYDPKITQAKNEIKDSQAQDEMEDDIPF